MTSWDPKCLMHQTILINTLSENIIKIQYRTKIHITHFTNYLDVFTIYKAFVEAKEWFSLLK